MMIKNNRNKELSITSIIIVLTIIILMNLSFVSAQFTSGTAAAAGISSGKRILHIGDSHVVGDYGQWLDHLLRTTGAKVETYGSCGTTSVHWLNGQKTTCGFLEIDESGNGKSYSTKETPMINALIAEFNPDIIIVSLGTNFKTSSSVTKGKIEEFLQEISGIKCFWVGAPQTKDSSVHPDEINAVLATVVAHACTFIDSTKLTDSAKITSGNIHYNAEGGKEWAQGVFNQLGIGGISVETPVEIPGDEEDYTSEILPDFLEFVPSTSGLAPSPSSQLSFPGPAVSGTGGIRAKEIDQAWLKINPFLGTLPEKRNLVWNPSIGQWKAFDEVYSLTASVSGATSMGTTSPETASSNIKVLTKKDYDPYFIQYGNQFQIPFGLVKAISAYESGLKPSAIGPAGEVGLLQFKASTAKSYFNKITPCCVKNPGEKYSCSDEKQSYGTIWGAGTGNNPYSCSPTNDDRFSPELNIKAGAQFIRKNHDYFNGYNFATVDDRIKLTIAAHHLGAGGLNGCIKGGMLNQKWSNSQCQKDISQEQLTWEKISNNFANQPYQGKSGTYKQEMDDYVNKIYGAYQKYSATMS